MSLLVPKRTITGCGSRHRTAEILGDTSGAVVLLRGRSAQWADFLADDLRASGRQVLEITGRGEPSLPILEELLAVLRPQSPGAVVAVGGGSVIDLGKGLAALLPSLSPVLDHLEVVGRALPLAADPLPFVAVPTTAGTGAEATKNAVIDVPDQRRKVSLRDNRMLPAVAILDPELCCDTPWSVTLACGMDAITQLIEPFLCTRATPETDALCRAAIAPAMAAVLRLSRGEDTAARTTLLHAAHLSGIALANSGLGAVHGLAGVIGGQTGAPHGAICARLLPAVLRANRAACAAAGLDVSRFDMVDDMIAGAFGTLGAKGTAAELLTEFLHQAPLSPLEGAAEMDNHAIAEMAAASSSMKANPILLSVETLAGIVAEGRALGTQRA